MCLYISKSFPRFISSLPVFLVTCNHRSLLTGFCRTNDCLYFRNAIGHTGHIHFLAKQLTEKLVIFPVLNWGFKLPPQPHSLSHAVINVLSNNISVKCSLHVNTDDSAHGLLKALDWAYALGESATINWGWICHECSLTLAWRDEVTACTCSNSGSCTLKIERPCGIWPQRDFTQYQSTIHKEGWKLNCINSKVVWIPEK